MFILFFTFDPWLYSKALHSDSQVSFPIFSLFFIRFFFSFVCLAFFLYSVNERWHERLFFSLFCAHSSSSCIFLFSSSNVSSFFTFQLHKISSVLWFLMLYARSSALFYSSVCQFIKCEKVINRGCFVVVFHRILFLHFVSGIDVIPFLFHRSSPSLLPMILLASWFFTSFVPPSPPTKLTICCRVDFSYWHISAFNRLDSFFFISDIVARAFIIISSIRQKLLIYLSIASAFATNI